MSTTPTPQDPILAKLTELRAQFLALSQAAANAERNMGRQQQFGAAAAFAHLKEEAVALAGLVNILGTVAKTVIQQHAEIAAITKALTDPDSPYLKAKK